MSNEKVLTTRERFVQMMNAASAISVDGGPNIERVPYVKLSNDPEKVLVKLTWQRIDRFSQVDDCAITLTEKQVQEGRWDNGLFFFTIPSEFDDEPGQEVEIAFYYVERLHGPKTKDHQALVEAKAEIYQLKLHNGYLDTTLTFVRDQVKTFDLSAVQNVSMRSSLSYISNIGLKH